MAKKAFRRFSGSLALILFSCAFACEAAHAQFSFPYDPDFAGEKPHKESPVSSSPTPWEPASQAQEPRTAPGAQPERPEAAPIARPEAPSIEELPAWIRSAGPFFLFDRPDPSHFFETPSSTAAPQDFEDFIRTLPAFGLDQARWNKMREDLERGALPSTEIETPSLSPEGGEFVQVSTNIPKPAPPEIELPSYGTSLSITGRKVVGFSFTEKRFLRPQRTSGRPQDTNLIDITQQLQLRMQGKVGPKITVNVDYDDTKTNKQDISVVYQGDPNEVVQNASFGDIDLSLPATEFVSYNKQLFGIRVNLKYKGLNAIFIGSRTKGQTKVKEFRGNSQFTTLDILDTSYIRYRYYDLTFGNTARLPLAAGSERVFLSIPSGVQANVNNIQMTVDDLTNSNSTFTGTFVQLSAGQDYTIDYVKGILTFKNTLNPQAVVAVNFVDSSNVPIALQTSTATGTSTGTGRDKIIKTFADVPIISSTTDIGFNREIKTFYGIGNTQIIRDNGRGNFIFKVLDQARNEVGPSLNPVQKYPDTISVDFENGVFQLQHPFGTSSSSPTPDPDLYSPTPITKRLFHLEMNFRLKTFFLEPNLVLQSEIVLLDNVKLQRNVDYFIDYESGFVTFFNEDRIHTDSVIDISYEVAPFAGNSTDSLLGTRISYDFNKHISVGSTLLYETGSKPPTVPTVSELAKSLLVYEADTQFKDLQLASWLKATFQGEIAQSASNPNLSQRALVDNMEGIRQEDIASMLNTSWQIASNPTRLPADPQALSWISEDVKVLAINPSAAANSNDTQKVLDLTYNYGINGTNETSVVYVFSPTGLDFSQKTTLEVTMFQSVASNNEINFHLGGINEDADGTGGTTLHCADGSTRLNAPKTEDTNCDGILQPSEDVGWLYSPTGKNSQAYGAGNGRIDSEDLNQNGRLDPPDFSGDDFGYVGGNPQLFDATAGSTRTTLDFTGWHTFQIPLNISSATASNWLAIKELRISIRQRPGGEVNNTIKFAKIAVVGNTWQRGQAGDPSNGSGPIGSESLTVNAVNNINNPSYVPIYRAGGDAQQVFSDLYGNVGQLERQNNTSNLSEQSLDLRFSGLTPGTTVFTKRVFPRSIDISQHHKFSFLVFGNADPNNAANGDKILFLRAGDDTNFLEMRIPITFFGWHKFTANQVDNVGDQIPRIWTVGQGTPGTLIVSSGTPNLQQVGEFTVGLYSTGTLTTAGEVFIDELYLDAPFTRKGNAQKLQMDMTAPGWANFGARYRFVDKNYQTPTTVVTNQDNRQDTAYLNFDRIHFFPMRFNIARTITVTPNTNATGVNSNLVNLLQQGKLTTWNGNASGNFTWGSWPRLNLGYDRNRIEYELLTRLDDRKTYNGTLNYGVPLNRFYLPRTVDLNYTYSKYSISFDSLASRLTAGNFNTNELTRTQGARLSFVPWTGSTFNPAYSLTTVREDRDDFTSGTDVLSSYPKSMNQSAGFSSNLHLLRWLNPSVSYNINTIENNNLTISTIITSASTMTFNVGDIKTINRSANGNVSLTLSMSEIMPSLKLLRSLNVTNGYQLQDGDVINNVEKSLDSRFALWVRTPLHPSNASAQLANQTLRDTYNSTQRWSPLEAYALLGRKAAFKTLSLTNNFLQSVQRTVTTGTPAKTISTTLPDVIASMGQLEQILFAERWMKNMQMNLKYAAHNTLNVGTSDNKDSSFGTDLRAMIKERFDTTLSFNLRNSSQKDLVVGQVTQTTDHKDATAQTTFDLRRFRFTPKIDYQQDITTLGTGIQTQNILVLTPSVLVRADVAIPRGLYLPFSKRTLLITNRIIWTSTLSLAIRSSPVTTADNSKLASFNTSADYEIAKNLRMTLNGALQRLWHKYLPEEDYISYQMGTTLTFQF